MVFGEANCEMLACKSCSDEQRCEGRSHMHMLISHVQARVSKLELFTGAAKRFASLGPTPSPATSMAHLKILRAFACLTVLVVLAAPLTAATANNAVTQWNSALQRTIRKLSIANQISSRYFSLLHVAQYQVGLVECSFAGMTDCCDVNGMCQLQRVLVLIPIDCVRHCSAFT